MSETNVDMLKPTELQIKKIAEEMEHKSAMEVLKWAINAYAPKIALASSFGAEDVILIDMMVKINKEKAKIFTLDRKSTRPELQSRQYLVCRLLLEKKNN